MKSSVIIKSDRADINYIGTMETVNGIHPAASRESLDPGEVISQKGEGTRRSLLFPGPVPE